MMGEVDRQERPGVWHDWIVCHERVWNPFFVVRSQHIATDAELARRRDDGGPGRRRRSTTARPNVVIFLADDQGWGDLSINGNTNLSTPNIDSLARDGAMLRSFLCLSGVRADAGGVPHRPLSSARRRAAHRTGEERLNLDESDHRATTFKAAGYATGAFGKWHNGSQWPYHPNARGFDEYYGFTSGHWGEYFDPPLEHNGKPVAARATSPTTSPTTRWRSSTENRRRPFFCYVPFNTPHSPMQVPERFYGKFERRGDRAARDRTGDGRPCRPRAARWPWCENIDWNVGRVLKRLDELRLADNTIVHLLQRQRPQQLRAGTAA